MAEDFAPNHDRSGVGLFPDRTINHELIRMEHFQPTHLAEQFPLRWIAISRRHSQQPLDLLIESLFFCGIRNKQFERCRCHCLSSSLPHYLLPPPRLSSNITPSSFLAIAIQSHRTARRGECIHGGRLDIASGSISRATTNDPIRG